MKSGGSEAEEQLTRNLLRWWSCEILVETLARGEKKSTLRKSCGNGVRIGRFLRGITVAVAVW